MTYFPDYLKTYPNMNTSSPLHISLNRLPNGFRAHRHDFLEFSYVVEGAGREAINETLHEMLPGTFTFVLPYQIHELYTGTDGPLTLYNCMFSMDLLMESSAGEGLLRLIDLAGERPFVQLEGSDRERMKWLIEDMYREYAGREPWRQTMLQTRLKEILVLFDRTRRTAKLGGTSGGHHSADSLRAGDGRKTGSIWSIIHYIHQHYQDELALSDLAARFSLSVSRMSEVIKETTGQTYSQFLRDLRLRHACGLLASTEMSVAEVAMEVGYGSYKTFSRVFRESKGLAPKDYRRSIAARRSSADT
ncbi:AraC family transcriptional regulator [Paenibacillus soyae]|uniref:AraC family transcriptional regulator n=1 Tax=Paenibacillus soyae TaxID=2969249 RepID=A0A9X2S884_9BACL|nr:AraC family transcriptional regulator [Paenibacillus soyae]MCR2803811.1 AraC family transcriptional regulator [Paenibacillus soyae]